jgi:hypothetical protein
MKRKHAAPIPKHVIGEARPGSGNDNIAHYYVRTRNTFIIARTHPVGLLGNEFFLLNPADFYALPDSKQSKVAQQMADFIAREVDEDDEPGAPHQVTPMEAEAPPEWLVCDNTQSRFTGVLHVTHPRFWMIPCDERCDETWIVPLADFEHDPTCGNLGDWHERACKFWMQFCEDENELHE